jgi:tetratricopeptide (TPR) repeat protein
LATAGTDAPTAYRLGNVAQRAGDDSLAVVAYARGEAADSQYPWNYIALGQLSARLNRLEPADTQLHQAVELQPSMQFLHYDLAMVELAEHKPADALRDFNAELGLTHDFRPALSGRALASSQLGRVRVAVIGEQSPSPSPSSSPTSSPSPSPSSSPSAAPTPTPTKAPVRVAKSTRSGPLVIPARLRSSSPAGGVVAAAQQQNPQPVQTATDTPSPTPTPAPTPMPASVTADARSYLLAVSRDLNFTRALPDGDPTMSTSDLQARLRSALAARTFSIEDLMRIGSSALLSGRLAIAERAFDGATGRAPSDWRGPYLQAMVARASGDDQKARTLLQEAASRAQRPEIFTSLAIVDLENGNLGAARQNAERAVNLEPNYTPGRFTAGMLALIGSDREAAARNLAAATNLSGAPARSNYFFQLATAH